MARADVYVSFDNVAVGTAQGEGIIECMGDAGTIEGKKIIQLHGSPTDNNATLFKQGYQDAIADSGIETVGRRSRAGLGQRPGWRDLRAAATPPQAARSTACSSPTTVSALAAQAVLAATAGLGKCRPPVRTPRWRACAPSSGTQCMTVYKPVKAEAEAAASLMVALANGDTAAADALATGKTADSVSGTDVPSVLLVPKPIYQDNVMDVINDGFTTVEKVCTTDEIKAACAANGVQ